MHLLMWVYYSGKRGRRYTLSRMFSRELCKLMANYKGRTFTSVCGECSTRFTATHQHKADTQAQACYETHYPPVIRDTREIMDQIKREIPDWDGSGDG